MGWPRRSAVALHALGVYTVNDIDVGNGMARWWWATPAGRVHRSCSISYSGLVSGGGVLIIDLYVELPMRRLS